MTEKQTTRPCKQGSERGAVWNRTTVTVSPLGVQRGDDDKRQWGCLAGRANEESSKPPLARASQYSRQRPPKGTVY